MEVKVYLRQLLLPVLLAMQLLAPAPASAAEKPLLMPGKHTLYQRVLAIPGSRLFASTDATTGKPVTPFTAYYVYQRERVKNQTWLKLGTDRFGDKLGWMRAHDTIAWNQGLTLTFRDPIDHDRALLFRDAASLQKVATDPNHTEYHELYQEAVDGVSSPDSPVVAIQPPGKLDIRKDFYLVPILKYRDIYLGNEQARMLEVASVPLKSDAATASDQSQTAAGGKASDNKGYRAGLVFVIDSTLSMDPYIQRTREAVMKIYNSLGDAGLLGNVNFGLVAFRDSLKAAPELHYLTRTYVTLKQGRNPATFLDRVKNLKAATTSSKGFIEDSYAGLKKAIDDMHWKGQAARYLVLITDAGPRKAGDPLSSTHLSTEALRKLAREKGIAIFVLHLLTPAGKANHASAAQAYRKLSDFPGIGSLYYGVPTGNVNEFGHVLDTLAEQITKQVEMAGKPPQKVASFTPKPNENPQLAQLQQKVARLGYALRMQYLQKTEGGKLPRVFNAWLLDRDILHPDKRTLDVRVLLTRDQLSDLHDILQHVLNTAQEGLLSPKNFLNELKSLAATITRNPQQLGETTATTAGAGNSLADLGFMREYIEGLPYTSQVMNISLSDWDTWPAREQIAFVRQLEAKIDYYQALYDHTDLWVSLDGGPVNGDSVFPVPLEMLP